MRSTKQGMPSILRLDSLRTLWSALPGSRAFKTAQGTSIPVGKDESGHDDSTPFWRGFIPLLIPLVPLLSLTMLFRLTDADIAICRAFYDAGDGSWAVGEAGLWKFVYSYGTLPGMAVGIAALAIGVASLAWRRLSAYRNAAFFLAAVLAVGPGLLVNTVFKPHWCRPRPRQIAEFGGTQQFVPVWSRTSERMCKSFPSGHASIGFYLMAPAFLFYRRRRRLTLGFVGLGLAGGIVLGIARIAQGGHFPSDVLWSAGMTYLSAVALYCLFGLGGRGALRTDVDDAAGFKPVVVAAEATRGIRPVTDERRRPDEEADRRKAA